MIEQSGQPTEPSDRRARVTLVQPPLVGRRKQLLTPPLGLLTLGAALRRHDRGTRVSVVDLNLELLRQPDLDDQARFYPWAHDLILGTRPVVLGFTSMGVEAHHCLELARRAKASAPGIAIVLGGPHFASHAESLLDTFPWIDFVATGAAEATLPALVSALAQRRPPGAIAGLAYRDIAGRSLTGAPAPRIDLEQEPPPDYDLIDLTAYFQVNPGRLACIEHARGCQLRCTFCYSEGHWGHGEVRKSNSRVVRELWNLKRRGVRTVFFVADNFLNSPTAAKSLCREIAAANLGLRWSCYATLAQLTPDVVGALSSAGCTALFVGVDAVSAESRKRFGKSYFKSVEALCGRIKACLHRGIQPMCSFLLSDEDSEDAREATLRAALALKVIGSDVCLNPLVRYEGTQLRCREPATALEYTEKKVRLLFDSPEVNASNAFARGRALEMFPAHLTDSRDNGGGSLLEFAAVADILFQAVPVTLMRSTLDQAIPLTTIVDELVEQAVPADGGTDACHLRRAVLDGFERLVRSSTHLSAVLDYERVEARLSSRAPVRRERRVSLGGRLERVELGDAEILPLYVPAHRLTSMEAIAAASQPALHLVSAAGSSARILCDPEVERDAVAAYRMLSGPDDHPELDLSGYAALRRMEVLMPAPSEY